MYDGALHIWKCTKIIISFYLFYFVISGEITIAVALDYEMSHNYFLTIKATDGGLRPLSDTAMVNIVVSDANDNKPMFSQDIYYSEMNEATRVEDSIAQVC